MNTYYVVDELGVLHTLNEDLPNPIVTDDSIINVTSDQEDHLHVRRYYASQIFLTKKGALNDYLKRKELELQFENANISRAKERAEQIRDKICQLSITINKLN